MSEEKALTLPERAAVALGAPAYEQEIRELVAKTVTITEVKNKDGRDQCHGAMMTLKNTRVAIEKAAKAAREDATAFSKAVIAEEKRLVALAEPEEARLQGLRDAWDAEIGREKAAKAAAEKARVDGIRKRIAEMQAIPAMLVGKQSQTIAAAIDSLEKAQITLESHQEFSGEAEVAKLATVQKLWEMFAAQQAHEAEAQRLAEERAALEAERRAQAERDKQIREARELDERLAREAREREQAKRLEKQAREDAERRARMKAEEEKLAEQRAELARQQAAIDAARAESERIERERLAAIEAEEQRKREEVAAAAQKAERERKEREREENLAARNAPQPTGGTWSVGQHGLTVVTTDLIAGCPRTGHNDAEYYGGNLICESVWRPADAHIIAAARDMFDLLKDLIHIEGPQPGNNAWGAKVQAVLAKATYVPEIQPEAQAA